MSSVTKVSELGKAPCLCTRCKNLKSVAKIYEEENGIAVQGQCDRCGWWSIGLWSMVRRSVLYRIAGVITNEL